MSGSHTVLPVLPLPCAGNICHHAGKHTYVKVRCEGDRSSPVYAAADKEGEEDAAVFEGSPEIIFIVLHSNAHVMMKVRDRREGGFFGTVTSTLLSCIGIADLAFATVASVADPD